MQSITRAERETIARFSEDPNDPLTFETFNKRHALRLIRQGATVVHTRTPANVTCWTLEMPRNWFKWPRPPRKLSEEQMKSLSDRGRKLRKQRVDKESRVQLEGGGTGPLPEDDQGPEGL